MLQGKSQGPISGTNSRYNMVLIEEIDLNDMFIGVVFHGQNVLFCMFTVEIDVEKDDFSTTPRHDTHVARDARGR